MFQPRLYTSDCKEPPYRIAWGGEVITVPRSEALHMFRVGLIKEVDDVRDPGPGRVAVKVEALQWHFWNIGCPVIAKWERGITRSTPPKWWISCKAWEYSAPSRNPLKDLGELYKEILDSAGIDLTPRTPSPNAGMRRKTHEILRRHHSSHHSQDLRERSRSLLGIASNIRFRFPFPWEDKIAPGDFDQDTIACREITK